MSNVTEEQADRRKLLRIVMAAVLLWGSTLAIGAALYGFDAASGTVQYAPNWVRGLIVEACVLSFLGVWLLALWRRPRSA